MSEEDLPAIPAELENYVSKAYGGLFGESVQINVVEEIVADPYVDYRPKDLEQIIGASSPSIRKALNNLADLGLLIKEKSDKQHPIYHVNHDSKKLIALTFLAYAVIDDRDGSDCMNKGILEYCSRVLRHKIEPLAIATSIETVIKYGNTFYGLKQQYSGTFSSAAYPVQPQEKMGDQEEIVLERWG